MPYKIANTVNMNKRAAYDGKLGCNTVEYTTVLLYSDWLDFLWHGIDKGIDGLGKTG